jgi:hypothetical protein
VKSSSFIAVPRRTGYRDAFLQDVAAALQGRSEIGDGLIYRVLAEVQRRHHDPPLMDHQPTVRRVLKRAVGDPKARRA